MDKIFMSDTLPVPTEGRTTDAQMDHIHALIRQYAPNVTRILEIGFNAGHSAESFLRSYPEAMVTSVDIGHHSYVGQGKAVIDTMYPGRHRLVVGDSTVVLPGQFADETFDVMFIDGGHSYEVSRADLRNCRPLAHADTLVFMDDTILDHPDWMRGYNQGPSRAWREARIGKRILELGREDYARGSGMAWGRYPTNSSISRKVD